MRVRVTAACLQCQCEGARMRTSPRRIVASAAAELRVSRARGVLVTIQSQIRRAQTRARTALMLSRGISSNARHSHERHQQQTNWRTQHSAVLTKPGKRTSRWQTANQCLGKSFETSPRFGSHDHAYSNGEKSQKATEQQIERVSGHANKTTCISTTYSNYPAHSNSVKHIHSPKRTKLQNYL